ncbi:MAG: GGDEF domain-containing protein [Lautropia sp.]
MQTTDPVTDRQIPHAAIDGAAATCPGRAGPGCAGSVCDPFATPHDKAFALTPLPPLPAETATIRGMRRLFLLAGSKGMAVIVTAASIVASVLTTALVQTLAGFQGWMFWSGIVVSIAVPLVVAPLVSHQFSALTQYLLGIEAQLHSLANRDALTGAPNRRWITERCEEAAAFAAATGRGYGVMMIDVDHFKSINDRHGHHGGDAVLRELVRILATGLRPSERFGRYGGEEFLVLTADTSSESLLARAEALRRAIAGTTIRVDGMPIGMTASIGAARSGALDADASLDDVLRRADGALYRAKAGGRDRVELADAQAPDDARRGPTEAYAPALPRAAAPAA